ncbi:glutathione S-transferase family protein [Acidisoma sp. C75]
MLKFYYNMAPNPMKVALFLEETGLAYEPVPIDTRKGDQHSAAYDALNPNHKVPVIEDDGQVVFDSNAILLYLGEKTGRFLSAPADRGAMLSWLMFVATGIGPYSGQCVHFRHAAPEPKDYPLQRYVFEAKRHWGIVDARLDGKEFLVGDTYTIVDMALWGWARMVPYVLGPDSWDYLPNVKQFLDRVSARPAAARAEALKERHAFKTETDEEARRALFPFLAAGQ